ncbi:hydrolase, partial [Enterococcus faecium]
TSVTSNYTDIDGKLASGFSIINNSAGKETAEAVRHFRKKYPELAIIATGGPTEESIAEPIQAGANAITYTPLSSRE